MLSIGGAFAKDIIPTSPVLVNVHTVGLYQVGNDVTIYKFPDENSQILYRVRWNEKDFFPQNISPESFFSVL